MSPSEGGLWVRRLDAASSGSTPISSPHTGGSRTCSSPSRRFLPPAIETLAIQYPGRQDRCKESFVDQISVLIESIRGELVNFVADKTFRPFGPEPLSEVLPIERNDYEAIEESTFWAGVPATCPTTHTTVRDIAHALVAQAREN